MSRRASTSGMSRTSVTGSTPITNTSRVFPVSGFFQRPSEV
jgi:hypothetical protein